MDMAWIVIGVVVILWVARHLQISWKLDDMRSMQRNSSALNSKLSSKVAILENARRCDKGEHYYEFDYAWKSLVCFTKDLTRPVKRCKHCEHTIELQEKVDEDNTSDAGSSQA